MWPLRFSTRNRRRGTALAQRPRTGFTVLELVVVMFVVILVTGMSMGKIHDIANQQKVIRAASTIRTSVEAAFSIAGRNRKPVRMSWDNTTMQFLVTDRAGTTVFRRVALGSGPYSLPANSVTFSTSPVEVYPNGLANSTLTVTFSANKVTRTVSVSRAGMVQTQ